MIFQSSPDIEQFVKHELERLFKSYSYVSLIHDENVLHDFVLEFIKSSKKLGEVIVKNTPNLTEMNNNRILLSWSQLLNFNPSFIYQYFVYVFRDARKELSTEEFIIYRNNVQKHYEYLFLQSYFCKTIDCIRELEIDDNNSSEIDELKSRCLDLKDKIQSFLEENPKFEQFKGIDGFKEKLSSFVKLDPKKFALLSTTNIYSFYRDVDISSVFNNSFLLYINMNIGYFNNDDSEGIANLNEFFLWYFKEKNKYKHSLQYLFEYLTTFCLVDAFLNINHLIDMCRILVKERRSVSIATEDFYLVRKSVLLNTVLSKKLPKSIRLDYEMLSNPLTDTLTHLNRSFSITSKSPKLDDNFNMSNIEFDSSGVAIATKFNPKNLYHVNLFLENYGSKILSYNENNITSNNLNTYNNEDSKYYSNNSTSYFDKSSNQYVNWYLNTFFKTFVFDYEKINIELNGKIEQFVLQLDSVNSKYFYNNLVIAKVLWFTKHKHSYLLDVVDGIYAKLEEEAEEDEHLEDRLQTVFGYLIHIETALDHLIDLQNSKTAKNWVKSFIPVRVKEYLDFESIQQYKEWKATILDFWEVGLNVIYSAKVFHKFNQVIAIYNTLLWFPIFSKKTANFDYGQWQTSILNEMVDGCMKANDVEPKFWLMGEFLFDYAIMDIYIDFQKQRDKASEIYNLFCHEFAYKDYLDFNDPEVINNAKKFVATLCPIDERIVLPCHNTSILHFLEQTKNKQDSMNLELNNSFKVQVRAKTRLIVHSTFLGAPIILSSSLKKSLEELNFKSSNLYDPLKIQQTLLKYEGYLEVLKNFNLDLMSVFEIYIQECNMCFLLNQHEYLLTELKRPNLSNNLRMTLIACLVYIEDSINVDCKFYSTSTFEANYMYRRNRYNILDLGSLDVQECRDFFDHHFQLLRSIFPEFPLCFNDKAQGLMIEILSHINLNKEVDLVYNNKLIEGYHRKVRMTRNQISSSLKFSAEEKETCLVMYDYFHEKAAFRANSEIFSMNEKAIEQLRNFEIMSSASSDDNIINFS